MVGIGRYWWLVLVLVLVLRLVLMLVLGIGIGIGLDLGLRLGWLILGFESGYHTEYMMAVHDGSTLC